MSLARVFFALCLCALLAGCASRGDTVAPAGALLQDHLFKPPARPIRAEDVFAVSPQMRRYLAAEIQEKVALKGRSRGLYEALYSRNLLRIEYDAAMTRNASETFEARSGNCLSLALMTAAFARQLGLSVRYQAVIAEEMWTRTSGLYLSSRHVNVTLGRRHTDPKHRYEEANLLTIDFMPVGELQVQRAWPISESTVVAMYMNNRAAENLAAGNANEAYWWAREATRQEPAYMSPFNTLGVIYRRLGLLAQAEAVLSHVLSREPENTHAMANLALVHEDQGRIAEARALHARLVAVQPRAPFQDFERGIAAMKRGDFSAARDAFAREIERDAHYHEFHFWLAAAYLALGDYDKGSRHLRTAVDNSQGLRERDLYAAKLERVRSAPAAAPPQ